MSKFEVTLICCGRDDGKYVADTWEQANDFREMYTSGVGVNEHGYSEAHAHEPGHKRAAIVKELAEVVEAQRSTHSRETTKTYKEKMS